MNTPVNVIVVEGKNITQSAELHAQGKPTVLKATQGAKYLFTSGKDGAVEQHFIVKRSGKNLQLFLNDGDDQPELVIEGFYDHPGELAGMGTDGQYHTFMAESGRTDAFFMMEDGSAMPLMMGSATTAGLSGLSLASSAAAGLSTGWLVAGAIGGLLALGGIAAAAGGGGSGDDKSAPAPAPQPINQDTLRIEDRVGSVKGDIRSGDVTDDARPLFSGTGTPGNVMRFYDNGQLIGSATIDANGNWSWQPDMALANGQHSLSLAEANRDGVEGSRSEAIDFEVDLTAPGRTSGFEIADGVGYHQGPINPGETTNDNRPGFSGKAEPGATVEIYDNGKLIGSVPVGADGQWSWRPEDALANGEHNFSAVVVDPAGNKGLPVNVGPVIIDDSAVDPADFGRITDGNGKPLESGDATNQNPLSLGGQGNPGDIVIIYDNGSPVDSVTVGPDGQWQYDLVLDGEGPHEVSFDITSPEGDLLARSDKVDVELDTTAPDAVDWSSVRVTDGNGNPVVPGASNSHDMHFSGTAKEGDIVRLYDGDEVIGTAIVGPDGNWKIDANNLEERDYAFRTEIEDRAGNIGNQSDALDMNMDFTAPDALTDTTIANANGDLISGDATNAGDLSFSGTGEAGDVVYLWDGETLVGTAKVAPDGRWSIPAEMSEERTYQFQTEVRDAAGNSSGKSQPTEIEYDHTAPNLTVGSIKDTTGAVIGNITDGSITDEKRPQITGSADPHQQIDIYNRVGGVNVLIGTAIADESGNWQFRPDADLAAGQYHLIVDAVDAAGNSTIVDTGIDFAITDLPVTPEITQAYNGFGPDADHVWVNTGAEVHDSRPVLAGTGEPNAIVLIYNAHGDILDTAIVDLSGRWEYKLEEDLALGSNNFTARYQMPDGSTSNASSEFNLIFSDTISIATETFNNIASGSYSVIDTDWYNIYQNNTQLKIENVDGTQMLYRAPLGNVDFRVELKHNISATDFSFILNNYEPVTYNSPDLVVEFYRDGVLVDSKTMDRVDNSKAKTVSFDGLAQFDEIRFVQQGAKDMWGIDDIKIDNVHIGQQYSDISSLNDSYDFKGNTLFLIADEMQLDLSKIAEQNIAGLHQVSLEGHGDNNLSISATDVLALGEDNLFMHDGMRQLMINGDAGDSVKLENLMGEHGSMENWNTLGQVTVGGVTYDVWQDGNQQVEVLIQQGVQTHHD